MYVLFVNFPYCLPSLAVFSLCFIIFLINFLKLNNQNTTTRTIHTKNDIEDIDYEEQPNLILITANSRLVSSSVQHIPLASTEMSEIGRAVSRSESHLYCDWKENSQKQAHCERTSTLKLDTSADNEIAIDESCDDGMENKCLMKIKSLNTHLFSLSYHI